MIEFLDSKSQTAGNPVLVHEYLTLSACRFPEKVALVCGDERWTYEALDQASNCMAAIFIELGVRRQDRVAIFLDNSAESVISIYAALKAGATFVVLHGALGAERLAYVLNDCGARVFVAHTRKAGVVRDCVDRLKEPPSIIWVGEVTRVPAVLTCRSFFWRRILDRANSTGAPSFSVPENTNRCIDLDLAALIYTSGSIGEPKGVMSSHGNMVAVARSIMQYLENRSDDIILNVLPLSFGYGLYQVITALMFGGTVILEKSFAFPIKVLASIQRERATAFPIVPTLAALILKMENLGRLDLDSLRYITSAAAALPVEHIRKLRAALPHVKLYSMYGLTECQRVSYLPPQDLDRKPDSVGIPIPNCEVFLLDEQGREVGLGEVGELVVRGANVMQGYWNAPELTSRSFKNGLYPGKRLLHSGDLFRKDEEGYLYFVGRIDEQIKTKGRKVSPREIESALWGLSGIAEVAAVGVPDELLGQAIKCFVVPRLGVQLTRNDVLKECSSRLENFMIPKYIEFVSELPKSPHGKIDRKALYKNDELTAPQHSTCAANGCIMPEE